MFYVCYRVVGVNANVTYEIPLETIKKRQTYWEDLFLDYSEQVCMIFFNKI